MLLFCACGSDRVDISGWQGRRAQIRCASCGHQGFLDGFTLSEFDPLKLIAALVSQAPTRENRGRDGSSEDRLS